MYRKTRRRDICLALKCFYGGYSDSHISIMAFSIHHVGWGKWYQMTSHYLQQCSRPSKTETFGFPGPLGFTRPTNSQSTAKKHREQRVPSTASSAPLLGSKDTSLPRFNGGAPPSSVPPTFPSPMSEIRPLAPSLPSTPPLRYSPLRHRLLHQGPILHGCQHLPSIPSVLASVLTRPIDVSGDRI